MSSNADVIKMWHQESWKNPPSSVISANEMYFSEDFQSLDTEGNVRGDKAGMNAVAQNIYKAFSGFKGVLHDVQEEADGSVTMTFHFEGTHTDDLDLSAMGMGVIPASGKSFVTPVSKTSFIVEDGQIVSSKPISGGFEYILAEIGAIPSG